MTTQTGGASAHTAGPWRASRPGTVVCDTPIPEIGGSDAVDYYGGHLVAESVAPQNIPLIAAAPDLLSALENITKAYADFVDPHSPRVKEARAALAQVKGERNDA